MDTVLIIIGMCLFTVLYIMTLYFLAHGKERTAVELGARLVMDSLVRQGRIAPEDTAREKYDTAVNLGDEEEEDTPHDLPDILTARSMAAAEQMIEKEVEGLNKVMGKMDEKV